MLDVHDAQLENLEDAAIRKEARRNYIHARMAEYTTKLIKNDFKVEVYQDRIVQLAQSEADMVGKQPGSVTQQCLEERQELLKP